MYANAYDHAGMQLTLASVYQPANTRLLSAWSRAGWEKTAMGFWLVGV
jgi:hypothetical protein